MIFNDFLDYFVKNTSLLIKLLLTKQANIFAKKLHLICNCNEFQELAMNTELLERIAMSLMKGGFYERVCGLFSALQLLFLPFGFKQIVESDYFVFFHTNFM